MFPAIVIPAEELDAKKSIIVVADTHLGLKKEKQNLRIKTKNPDIDKELNLYSTLSCFAFKKEDVVKCPILEFRRCKTLMKSKKPLPELIFSRYGASIKNVVSLDGEYEFVFTTAEQYRRNQKRSIKSKDIYIYLGEDNHLYIPDHEILMLDLIYG